MKKKTFVYVMIVAYGAFILSVLYDIFHLGYAKVRMYQLILAVVFAINLFYLIKNITKNEDDADTSI